MKTIKRTVQVEYDFDKEDALDMLEKYSGSFDNNEKIRGIRSILDLNQVADIATIVAEIINLKR